MALSGSAVRRYAEAVLDVATEEGAVDEYRAALERLSAALGPADMRTLGDPSIPLARRLAAADAVTKEERRPVAALVRLLIERERIGSLPLVAAALGDLVDERAGIAEAQVTTAVEIAKSERAALVERLERATGKTIRAAFAVDPGLLGGATVRVGDRLVDASLRTRLESLRRQLATT